MPRNRALALLAVAAILTACSGDSTGPKVKPTGSLSITVSGLPAGIQGAVTVTGPNGFSQLVTVSQTLAALTPGQYTLTSGRVITPLATFVASTLVQTVTVVAGSTPIEASVGYTITTGSINLVIAGLPNGLTGKVLILGPGSYFDSVSTTATLGNLLPGVYNLTAANASAGTTIYAPKPQLFSVAVPASIAPTAVVIGYYLASGSLSINVNGLPAGFAANVNVTGPSGYAHLVTNSVTLDGLLEGRYDLSAAGVTGGNASYAASPTVQSLTVAPGATSTVNVNYSSNGNPTGLNLSIDAVAVQQVVQTYGGTVPMVAGRDGLLRVFVKASIANAATPAVRVRLYDGVSLTTTAIISAPVTSVPTTIVEGSLASSWNYPIPASLMKPGLKVLVDVDPSDQVAETSETDNVYPSSGTPLTLDVRQVPVANVRLVPITQSANGLTGDINAISAPQFAAYMEKVLPVQTVNLDVRTPYTTSTPALQPNDQNGSWLQVLSEINALRTADGSVANYYGVVKTSYTSGIIGIGYVPGFAAMGWDVMPNAGETLAHELGHNFGRFHSPCGGAGAPDANYPYAGGSIGVYGYNPSTGTLFDPSSTSDIMGYCTQRWISDYTYVGIMNNRGIQNATFSLASLATAGSAAPRPGILVWGRISHGNVVLEPAFEVNAPPHLPQRQGRHRLDVLGTAGELLERITFDGEHPADVPDPSDEHFAFVIPLDAFGGRVPARLRLAAATGGAELTSTGITPTAQDFAPTVDRISPTSVRVSWKDAPGRGVLVREAGSGAILSFARGGRTVIRTAGADLDLTLSDGVRSVRQRVAVKGLK